MESETTTTKALTKKLRYLTRLTLKMLRRSYSKNRLFLSITLLNPHLFTSPCKSSNDVVSSSVSRNHPDFSSTTNRRRRSRHFDAVLYNAGYQSPGLGMSPAGRQLRVTDSPFSAVENEEESVQVSRAADEFIGRFYRDLRMQKGLTVDCPVHDTWKF